ncbi:hypothetical protein MtrunA17_Chr2g0332251 [Medicago truncatula]|uniref:Uncharacterized protein n=1 Tax=Medicago truncatula TaxID=3880 RepID=A0A396JE25_MEDTR|nr:hypothetical protein MtrunA17_Chr2g0332251 [Medicago truncatula]
MQPIHRWSMQLDMPNSTISTILECSVLGRQILKRDSKLHKMQQPQ